MFNLLIPLHGCFFVLLEVLLKPKFIHNLIQNPGGHVCKDKYRFLHN